MTMLPGVNFAQNLQWQPTNGPCGGSVSGFVMKDSIVLAWAETGTYRSTNNGDSWQVVAAPIGPFVVGDSMIFGLGNGGGIYRSGDDGMTWKAVATGSFSCVAANGSMVIAQGDEIIRSTNSGDSWNTISASTLAGVYVQAIVITETSIIAGTAAGIYRSTDTGNTWTEVPGITKDSGIQAMVQSSSAIYAAGGAEAQNNYTLSQYIFVSTDDGLTWTYSTPIESYPGISSLMTTDSTLYVIDVMETLYMSSDHGKSWIDIQPAFSYGDILGVYANGQTIFLATGSGGTVRSTDGGASWLMRNIGIYVYGAITLSAVADTIFVPTNASGIFRTQDEGNSWTALSGVSDHYDQRLVSSSSGLYLAAQDVSGPHLFRSTDDGNSWNMTNIDFGFGQEVLALAAVGDTIYAGCDLPQISTDAGNTWSYCSGLPGNFSYAACLQMGAGVVYATGPEGFYRSFDQGSTWTPIGTGAVAGAFAIYAEGSTVYAVVNQLHISGTLFRSVDYGENWQQFTTIPTPIGSIIVEGKTFIVTTPSGVFISSDEGISWSAQNYGLTDSTEVGSLVIADSKIYAPTANRGVFVANFSNSLVGIAAPYQGRDVAIAPNPFSSFSTIHYSLPLDGSISITIIDPLGRVVAKPLDEEFQEAGQHEIQLDASKLAAGIYLCRLNAGGIEQETKFVVER